MFILQSCHWSGEMYFEVLSLNFPKLIIKETFHEKRGLAGDLKIIFNQLCEAFPKEYRVQQQLQ